MAIWKRKKKKLKESEEHPQETETKEIPENLQETETKEAPETPQETEIKEIPENLQETEVKETSPENAFTITKEEDTTLITGTEETPVSTAAPETETEEPYQQEEFITEKMPEFEVAETVRDDKDSGVILFGRKISGFVGKGFWSALSIAVLPPLFSFAFGILIIVFMLIFPLLGAILVASVPVVLVTLFIFFIAIPVLFPLLILFLLITGKGRLVIGSEGKWVGIELFGKNYSIK